MRIKTSTFRIKKFLSALFVFGTILTTTMHADFIRMEMGAGIWAQTPAGEMDLSNISDETEAARAYAWAIVKHPIPLIPNVRVEYTNVVSSTGGNINVKYEMVQYDFVPYYNILDNTAWVTLDIGLDLKVVSAKEEITDIETDSTVFPLAYLRTRFQLPFSGLAAEADVKYLSYDANTVYDVRAKIDYTFTSFPVIEPAIEFGYRVQKFETDELLGAKMNMEFAGIYLGLMARF